MHREDKKEAKRMKKAKTRKIQVDEMKKHSSKSAIKLTE